MPDRRKQQRAAEKYKERNSHHFSQGQKKRINKQTLGTPGRHLFLKGRRRGLCVPLGLQLGPPSA
jgi:hypothetical protein